MRKNGSIRKSVRNTLRLIEFFNRLSRNPSFQKTLDKIRKDHRINVERNKRLFKLMFMNSVRPEWRRIYLRVKGLLSSECFDIRPLQSGGVNTYNNKFITLWNSCAQDVVKLSFDWNIRVLEARWIVMADVYPPYFGIKPLRDYDEDLDFTSGMRKNV